MPVKFFGSSCFLLVVFSFIFVLLCSAVVELTSSTFEHLTQATTGHTTGDWLVKFYAPWYVESLPLYV